jgi:hypothetical protein
MAGPDKAKSKVRIVLPAAYAVISGLLLVPCFLRLGHSSWCQYFINSMFPARLIIGALLYRLLSSDVVQQSSELWKILEEILVVPVPFILTIGQYYLIGLLIDRCLSRRA